MHNAPQSYHINEEEQKLFAESYQFSGQDIFQQDMNFAPLVLKRKFQYERKMDARVSQDTGLRNLVFTF